MIVWQTADTFFTNSIDVVMMMILLQAVMMIILLQKVMMMILLQAVMRMRVMMQLCFDHYLLMMRETKNIMMIPLLDSTIFLTLQLNNS